MELIGQSIGFLAIVASVLIYQQTNRNRLLICKAVSDVLWILHFFLLGAYTGAVVTCIALGREVLFFKSSPQDKKGKWILFAFMGISTLSTILTWKSIFSILALFGSLISIVSFWVGNPKLSRILAFPVSVCMLIYGVSNGSVAALINEVLVLTSSVIGVVRYDLKLKK